MHSAYVSGRSRKPPRAVDALAGRSRSVENKDSDEEKDVRREDTDDDEVNITESSPYLYHAMSQSPSAVIASSFAVDACFRLELIAADAGEDVLLDAPMVSGDVSSLLCALALEGARLSMRPEGCVARNT